MAKKKINIILIAVVLGLWGTVGYRAINRQFTGNAMIPKKQTELGNATINQINKDTFKLEEINRDPFLNKQFQTAVTAPRVVVSHYRAVRRVTVPPTAPKSDPHLKWPTLSYHGYIGSKERNEDLVLLKIDSKFCKLKLNHPINGLVVKKRYKDSIEVSFNSETRMVRLK